MLGPVHFQFIFDGPFAAPPTISGVDFYWGTGGDHGRGSLCTTPERAEGGGDTPVPEPHTLALLALALLGMAGVRYRFGYGAGRRHDRLTTTLRTSEGRPSVAPFC